MSSVLRSRLVLSLLGLAVAMTLLVSFFGVGAPVAEANAMDPPGPDTRTASALDDDGCYTVVTGYRTEWRRGLFGILYPVLVHASYGPQVTIKDGSAVPATVATGDLVKIQIIVKNRASAATVPLRATIRYPNGQNRVLNREDFTVGFGTFVLQTTEPWDLTVQSPPNLGTYYIDAEVMSNDDNVEDRSSCA